MKRKNKPFSTIIALVLVVALNLAGMGFASYQLFSHEVELDVTEARPQGASVARAESEIQNSEALGQGDSSAPVLHVADEDVAVRRSAGVGSFPEFEFYAFMNAIDFERILRVGMGDLTRFYRAGVLRIPSETAQRLEPVAGLRVTPEHEREDDATEGQQGEHVGGLTFPALDANRGYRDGNDDMEANAGEDAPNEGISGLAYEYFPPDYEQTPLDNEVAYDEDEDEDYEQGENDDASPEDSEDNEAQGGHDDEDEDTPEAAENGGADEENPDDDSYDYPDNKDVTPAEDEDEDDFAADGAGQGDEQPESPEDDDEDGQGSGEQAPNEDEQDEDAEDGAGSTDDDNEPFGDSATPPSTTNPQTSDDFALLGLIFTSIGFLSSSLILTVVIFERKARGR